MLYTNLLCEFTKKAKQAEAEVKLSYIMLSCLNKLSQVVVWLEQLRTRLSQLKLKLSLAKIFKDFVEELG